MKRALLVAAVLVSSLRVVEAEAASNPTLVRAGVTMEATNDMREKMAPAAGQTFLWVTVKADAAQTIDLTKVKLAVGAGAAPLIGVDSAWDGDPKQFSMIAPVTLVKTGKASDPMEMTRSEGSLAFAYAPGKAATLKVEKPPASFCLLFSVPKDFKTGAVSGLASTPLPVPAATAKP
jgi:hypothetical protein